MWLGFGDIWPWRLNLRAVVGQFHVEARALTGSTNWTKLGVFDLQLWPWELKIDGGALGWCSPTVELFLLSKCKNSAYQSGDRSAGSAIVSAFTMLLRRQKEPFAFNLYYTSLFRRQDSHAKTNILLLLLSPKVSTETFRGHHGLSVLQPENFSRCHSYLLTSATALQQHGIQFLLLLKIVPPCTVSSATSSLAS